MSQEAIITWIIVAIVIIVVIGLIWWYFSQPATPSTAMTTTQSSQDSILSFNFEGLTTPVTGTINDSTSTIVLMVPTGTDVTDLTPTVVVSDYATVSPASGTPQDFTQPVVYTVTAQDGSTRQYTVTVTAGTAATMSAGATTNTTVTQ